MRVHSIQGDTVDLVCWRELGSERSVSAVLARNPDLAALGPVLPAGTPIDLPDTPTVTAPTIKLVQLWD
ncbi:tail protein X [uncultured Croceicoccus sp.]|uniref:tail protein X n=1 Tax=uncultured Croceicoccus sp. TaxID=1295329 RepID=UPI0026145DE1|nr:tail protein X [uncultured Croceicoccus sp.]